MSSALVPVALTRSRRARGRRSFKSTRVRGRHSRHLRGFAARRHKRLAYARRTNTEVIQNIGGLADRQFVKLKYATTSAFTTTGGVASYLQLKLNSVYRPYAGNTDSDGGSASMFSRYVNCFVHGSRVTIRLWSSATGAVPEPFRIVLVPVTPANYTTLSGLSNIVTITDMPHAVHKLVSPGASMPTVTAYCSVNSVFFGDMKQKDLVLRSSFSQTTGADPATLGYWLVGYQNMAGTTNLDLQAEVTIEHYCEFYSPIMSTLPQVTWTGSNDELKECKDPKVETKVDLSKDTDVEMRPVPVIKRKMSVTDQEYEMVKALKAVKIKS